jgi:hypothetical protein
MALSDVQKKNLNRVMKLLSMTQANGCSANEEAVAKAQAEKLIKAHNLSADDLSGGVIGITEGYYLFDENDETYFKIPVWRRILFQYVNEAFGVSAIGKKDSDGDDMVVRSGTDVDIEIGEYCDEILFFQIIELANEYKEANGLRKNSKQYNSFLSSLTNTVVDNLRTIFEGITSPGKTKNMYEEAQGRANKGLIKYKEETGSNVKTKSSTASYNADGVSAASRVSINGALNGNTSSQKRLS